MKRKTALGLASAAVVTSVAEVTSIKPAAAARETTFNHETLTKFSSLVAQVWSDKNLRAKYDKDPKAVLKAYGVRLPEGVPTPVIPQPPPGGVGPEMGRSWKTLTYESWAVTVDHSVNGGIAAGISVSSLACIACPVSSFSSLSNG